MLLQLRMLSDEDDNFLRDYLLSPRMTLAEIHAFICDDLHYEPENMTSFFTSNDQWERLREFTSMDMEIDEAEAPASMDSVTLGEVLQQQCRRLIYLFDMIGNRAYYMEVVDLLEEEAPHARVLLANGEAPDQFDADASPRNRSIFDEIMSDFDDFTGEDNYSDDE